MLKYKEIKGPDRMSYSNLTRNSYEPNKLIESKEFEPKFS